MRSSLRVDLPTTFTLLSDVGCNNGTLTLAVAGAFGPRRVVGVEIDGALVLKANECVVAAAEAESMGDEEDRSRQAPPPGAPILPPGVVRESFPVACEAIFGPLASAEELGAIQKAAEQEAPVPAFPENIEFVQADFLSYTVADCSFDTVMWSVQWSLLL